MKKNIVKITGLIVSGIIVVLSFGYALNVQPVVFGNPFDLFFDNENDNFGSCEIETFSSYEEFIDFLKDNNYNNNRTSSHYYYVDGLKVPRSVDGMLANAEKSTSAGQSDSSFDVDFSETNIQVEGVDEPDIVKTDGKYIYLLSNSKIYIIKAYPENESKVLSTIDLDDIYVSNLFLRNNKLIVFGSQPQYHICYGYYRGSYESDTDVNIYDISDRNNPEIDQEIKIDGSFIDARLIGDNIYIITSENTYNIYREIDGNETISIPEISINNVSKKIPVESIHYVNSSQKIDSLTYVVAVDLETNEVNQESFMFSSSSTLYVSKNNIYLTYSSYEYLEPDISKGRIYGSSTTKTIIHKISIDDNNIEYISKGEVPGRIINQFSMDEHNGFFRIATQTNDHSKDKCSNVFVLNDTLSVVGKITDIAPNENMHSARFMGNRAYLVTFLNIDPFFVIDLSDPYNPEILGELKIPGYSDYLHPYDENHVIGIGKDSDASIDSDKIHSDNAVFYTAILGVKIALFDVTDPENPKEVSKVVIGDRGSNTPVLHNHKALLFDREKELFVIPLNAVKRDEETGQRIDSYQGAYVYNLNSEDGFIYKGRISHENKQKSSDIYYDYYSSFSQIKRSLFIDDTLYTISDSMIKLNQIKDLNLVQTINLE